jgi:phosphatidate cytidylyltransferase
MTSGMTLSPLLTRIISAVILLPVVLVVIYVGGDLYVLLVGVVLGLATLEFVQLMERGGARPTLFISWGFVAVGVVSGRNPDAAWIRAAVAGLLGGALVWQLFQHPREAPTADWALTVVGGLYIGWMGGYLVALRSVSNGLRWLLLALLTTWAADTGAYLIGSNWGRRKLIPRLSPGKTVEGTVGGWLTGVVSGGVVAMLLELGVVHGLALGILIGIASPLADLGVSMMKRQVGAKDSSRVIPGHGGVLDRIDSILFTVVVGYYYVQWVVF